MRMDSLFKISLLSLTLLALGRNSAAQQPEPQVEEVIPQKDHPIAAGTTRPPSTETISRRDAQITEELKQIRAQLARIEKRLADAIPVKDSAQLNVNVSGGYALGQKDAAVILAEFGDYQCPYCRRFYTEMFQKLRKNYIETGKVRFVALNLPLGIHPNAFHAAEAALCAGEQSKFWEMHELLLTSSNDLGADALLRDAEHLRLNKVSFQSCLDSGRLAAKVKQDMTRAQDLGISGTPTFILGRSRNGQVAGVKLVGVQSYDALAARIQGLLDPKPKKRE